LCTSAPNYDERWDRETEEVLAPTPKNSLQTKEQKDSSGREEKSKQTRRENAPKKGQDRKQASEQYRNSSRKPRQASYDNLPAELKLHIMRHTHLDDIASLTQADHVAHSLLWREKGAACIRGMEDEQFSQLKWLFGDSKFRTPEQKQSLKDWFATSQDDDDERDEKLIQHMIMIDDEVYLGWISLLHFQKFKDQMEDDIEFFKGFAGVEMSSRTAAYMVTLNMNRPEIVNLRGETIGNTTWVASSAQIDYRIRVDHFSMEVEDRIRMYDKQPVTTKAEITEVLETVIAKIAKTLMGIRTAEWIKRYYSGSSTDPRKTYTEMRIWVAEYVVSFLMHIVLDFWSNALADYESLIDNDEDDFSWPELLELAKDTPDNAENYCKTENQFAEHIGFGFDKVLVGTTVQNLLDDLLAEEVTRSENERLARRPNARPID
jgi:hypothetical protein